MNTVVIMTLVPVLS